MKDWRDGSAVTALGEDLSLVSSTRVGWVMTAYNFDSRASDNFWSLQSPAYALICTYPCRNICVIFFF